MKKKIIIPIAILLVIGIGITVFLTMYHKDSGDTEELFKENVDMCMYDNTLETALPQTVIYDIINEHFAAPLPEGKTEKKAIIFGFDGCRADALAEIYEGSSLVQTLMEDEQAPILLTYCGGVPYGEVNTQATSTAPGWCSILTGKWADETTVTANDITKPLEPKTLLVSLTEDKIIDKASFITKWAGHFDRENATYLEEKAYCESQELNVDYIKTKNDKGTHEALIKEVTNEDCSDFIFAIYEATDSVGHKTGFSYNNPLYKKAFLTLDEYGLEAIEAIRARETYDSEDWLFILTSDHGGFGTGHGKDSLQERMTFLIVNKDVEY